MLVEFMQPMCLECRVNEVGAGHGHRVNKHKSLMLVCLLRSRPFPAALLLCGHGEQDSNVGDNTAVRD